MSKLVNLAVHWPSKVWPVGKIARKICSTIERIFKIRYTTGHFIPKKYLSLVFYDNRNLKISKKIPRNRNSISVTKSKFLSVFSMNTLLAILKVTDTILHVTLAGGLYHRFPCRHLPPPHGTFTFVNIMHFLQGFSEVFLQEWSKYVCRLLLVR